jgi:hypothetical protein
MSHDALDAELAQASAELHLLARLRVESDALEEDLARRRERLDALERELRSETRDTERLEGLTLTALFYTILGSREEQLERERQELLAATLKRDACAAEMEIIHAQQGELEHRIAALSNVALRYQQALERKEQWLLSQPSAAARRLREVGDEMAEVRAIEWELQEALAAGASLLRGLDVVLHALWSAEDWGSWDMFGGGTIITVIKHSRIDEAEEAMHEIQPLQDRLSRELADLKMPGVNLEWKWSERRTFADWFFDCLITDWVVQEGIETSLENTLRYGTALRSELDYLRELHAAALGRIETLSAERASLIESS